MGGLKSEEKRNSDLAREICTSDWQTGMELARHLRSVSRSELARRLGVAVRDVLEWELYADIPDDILVAAGLVLRVSPGFIDNADDRMGFNVCFMCTRSGPDKGVRVLRAGVPTKGECYNCGEVSLYLCDGLKGDSETCDRDLCDVCATAVGRNKHLCPDCVSAPARGQQVTLFAGIK